MSELDINNQHTGQKEPRIRRGRVDSLTLYEITDHELDVLERGSPSSIELNFAIALISVFVSLVVTLATATFESPAVRSSVTLATLVSAVLGVYFLVKWLRTHHDVKDVVKRIKERIRDESEVPIVAPKAPIADAHPVDKEEAG